MGADQNFSRNRSVGLYPENQHKPLNLGLESSYGLAISKQKPLGRETEVIRKNSPNSSSAESDRLDRPVRPVSPRQPATKAPNGKSQANEV